MNEKSQFTDASLSDKEILSRLETDRQRVRALVSAEMGSTLDRMDIFLHRAIDWFGRSLDVRSVDELMNDYPNNPSAAYELAMGFFGNLGAGALRETIDILRGGAIMSLPRICRYAGELRADCLYVQHETSGTTAQRWLDWKVHTGDIPSLLEVAMDIGKKGVTTRLDRYRQKKKLYLDDEGWAQLPNGKKHRNPTDRMNYVIKLQKEQGLPADLAANKSLIMEVERTQMNAVAHPSPGTITAVHLGPDWRSLALITTLDAVAIVFSCADRVTDCMYTDREKLNSGPDALTRMSRAFLRMCEAHNSLLEVLKPSNP